MAAKRTRKIAKEPARSKQDAYEKEAAVAPKQKRRRLQQDEKLPKIPSPHNQLGRVYVCGYGDSGQLGLGNLIPDNDEEDEQDDPSEVKAPRRSPLAPSDPLVRQVVAGGMHSVAVTEAGDIFTTGVNDEAALGRRTDAEIWKSASAAEGLGDAYTWGKVDIPKEHGVIVEVDAGDSHTVALTEYGAIWAWGTFRGNSGPWAFSKGQQFALRPTLIYQPASEREQVVRVSSGCDHVLALRRDGTVMTWGFGEQGQLGRVGVRMADPERAMLQPADLPLHNLRGMGRRKFEPIAVSAGSFSSFVVSRSGHVAAFGMNASGQLGLDVKDGPASENIVLRPTLVNSLPASVKAIGAGKAHTLALQDNGSALSFGLQTYGRLGRSDAATDSDGHLAPGPVSGLDEIRAASVIAGADTSAIVTAEGSAYVFGMGSNYQLANGTDKDARVPRKIAKEVADKVLGMAFGGQHTLLLVKH